MSSLRHAKGKGHMSYIRPILIGIAVSITASLIFICIISAMFSLLECIAKNLVGPLSVISVALGCFVGGYICSSMSARGGAIIGLIISVLIFCVMYIIRCFGVGIDFENEIFIKFIIMLIAGACGGYLGSKRKYSRKRR